MKKLRVGDPVLVIAGKYKGKTSVVESLTDDLVLVKWVNEVKKAVKGKGFIKKTLPIHVSNVMYYLETEKKPTKVKILNDAKGKKIRQSKKTNVVLK